MPERLTPGKTRVCRDLQLLLRSRADASPYLRVAQTYMLISMPTCTSTIFGVFQVIWLSQAIGANARAIINLGPPLA